MSWRYVGDSSRRRVARATYGSSCYVSFCVVRWPLGRPGRGPNLQARRIGWSGHQSGLNLVKPACRSCTASAAPPSNRAFCRIASSSVSLGAP